MRGSFSRNAEALRRLAEELARRARDPEVPDEELERLVREADEALHRCRCSLNAARYLRERGRARCAGS